MPPRFLTPEAALAIREKFGSPVYVYDKKTLERAASDCLAFPNAFGLTARYAMKAAPTAAILRVLNEAGMHIDAGSGFEAVRAIAAGVKPSQISISSQEFPHQIKDLYAQGVIFTACSLHQIELFGQMHPGGTLGIRVNPGVGSGWNNKTNVGGPTSSFGIWHELLDQADELLKKYDLKLFKIHTHIGSGSDPAVWQKVSVASINILRRFPSVTVLNLGGGFKVARVVSEVSTDLQVVGKPVKEAFEKFAEETGRQIKLEIEPGTYLLANSGCLLATVQDITTTGAEGYTFLKLDSGMTEIMRPSLYGAQHPYSLVQTAPRDGGEKKVIIVGHCCESGDLITVAPGQGDILSPLSLAPVQIGDMIVADGAGAYCSSMSCKNYNSYPEVAEVMVVADGDVRLIRKRQTMEQMLQNELPL